MNNALKKELAHIVNDIPDNEVKQFTVTKLWRTYANDFEYATFRKYLKAIKGIK